MCSSKQLGVRLLYSMLFLLCFVLFLSIYFVSSAMLERVNCVVSVTHPLGISNPDKLSIGEFTGEYLSLSDKVKGLGPGEKLINSFFHYFTHRSNSVKKRTLIAVVTAQKYLRTRVKAIYETWAQDVGSDSAVYFFVGEDCDTTHPDLKHLPIIKVHGVRDNVYPPQEKVFAVLAYVYLNFGVHFRWFVRADDDVYIRVKGLEAALGYHDSTELLYLGHPGYGKKKDRERLKLLTHENYCMGGPGIVFSAASLKALYPHLGRCLIAVEAYNHIWGRDIGWYNEDVELGRCVSRCLGINCNPPTKVRVSE